jgi:hypothetical protein
MSEEPTLDRAEEPRLATGADAADFAGSPRRLAPRVAPSLLSEVLRAVETIPCERFPNLFRYQAAARWSGTETEHLAGRALLLLLADLAEQGWRFQQARGAIWVTPPAAGPRPGETLSAVKERLRAPLLVARRAQLATPSVRAFLRRMEARRLFHGRRTSVLDLSSRA